MRRGSRRIGHGLVARRRVVAAQRKLAARQAERVRAERPSTVIGEGVRAVALDLEDRQLALPLYVTAPLIYACEMVAVSVVTRFELAPARTDDVSRYLMAGLQEFAVGLIESFDVEHFERWTGAAVADARPGSTGEALEG